MVLQQSLQAFFAGQTCGLQELAQLMDLDLLVHFEKPLAGLLDRLLRRIFQAGFQVGARRAVRSRTPAPMRCTEDGAGALRATPRPSPSFLVSESWFHDPVGNFLGKAGSDRGASAGVLQRHHGGFGIQCAVGILQPQPVGKLKRQSGREQHFTGVPNSITVLSVAVLSVPDHPSQAHRNTNRTSLRKELRQFGGAALLPDTRSARGLCGHCEYLGFPGSTRPGSPGLPVSMARAPGPHRQVRMHSRNQSRGRGGFL